MQDLILTCGPVEYAQQAAVENLRHELDIATEIFIAQQRAIHYADMMDTENGEATKTMLISWLNDFTRSGKTRDGIITLYKAEMPAHFVGGKWRAQHLPEFVGFALRKLTSAGFVKDKNRALMFYESCKSESWFWQAASVMSIKLMEGLYHSNGLQSMSARFAIGEMLRYREMWDKFGKLVGRVGKVGGLDDFTRDELKNILQSGLSETMRHHTSMLEQTKEYVLFEKHVPAIKGMLRGTLQESVKLLSMKSGA